MFGELKLKLYLCSELLSNAIISICFSIQKKAFKRGGCEVLSFFIYLCVNKTTNHMRQLVIKGNFILQDLTNWGGQIGSYRQLVDENGDSIISTDAIVIEGDVTLSKCQDTDYDIIVTGEVIGKTREEV